MRIRVAHRVVSAGLLALLLAGCAAGNEGAAKGAIIGAAGGGLIGAATSGSHGGATSASAPSSAG